MKLKITVAALLVALSLVPQLVLAQKLTADWPHWAYGYLGQPTADELDVPSCPEDAIPRSCGPTGTPREDDGIKLALPGTSLTFTRAEANNSWRPADWYPGDHPKMPEIVASGRRDAGIRPCALCHLPNGQGKMENGHVTGLPVTYFLQQLEAFASGQRFSADPRKANTNEMARIARALTDVEKRQAAEYFSAIKFRSMLRVVETDTAPQVSFTLNRLALPMTDAAWVPLGQRIVEVPESPEQTEVMRNPRGTFISYVPIGSVAKGEELASGSGNPAVACTTCHGPSLQGIGDIPSIAGRTASYTVRQLWDMKQGTRLSPLMDPVVANLSAEDMLNIAAFLATQPPSQTETSPDPDYVFLNGKVLTVDDEFSIVEAVAITGNGISAVGRSDDVAKLAGENTQVIDLDGKTMTPGIIDAHNHLIYNAAIWPNNVRLEVARTRVQALQLLAAKAEKIGAGDGPDHILFGLGGWKPLQFSDDPSPFTRDELDAVVPNNPALVGDWSGATLNSKAMEYAGISADTPDPDPKRGKIWRDDEGVPTGYFTGSVFIKWDLRPLFPEVTGDSVVTGLKAEIDTYLSFGVTTSMTYNGPQFPEELLYHVRDNFADTPEQKMRIYYPPHFNNNVSAWTPDEVAYVIEGLSTQKPFTGSEMFQLTHFGEHVYLPIPGDANVPDEDWAIFKQIATVAAKHGWQVSEHGHRRAIVEKEIEIYEEINKEHPITDLRWRVEHGTTITADLIDRMKALGMLHSIQSHISITTPVSRAATPYLAEAAGKRDMPPLQDIRASGIIYGLGSDAQIGGRDSPFYTMGWLVSGKDVTGQPYFNHGTLSREEALIAHTRSNAYLMFKEDTLGSIEVGKLADLTVLDRDYMTVPVDQIRDLQAVLTMVDGRIVYER